ncbi:MAG: inositol monophosphatase [Oligoflexia bacterium]|nr:inositol monophosphatase [Oligoflexia bacterium]
MQTQDLSKLLTQMRGIAAQAAALIADGRNSNRVSVKHKGRDHVTNLDLQAEEYLIKELRLVAPDAAFLTEESSPQIPAQHLRGKLWIIDPIDGTTNFARGHLHCAVSVAYAENGVVLAGVVDAPFLGEVYHAIKGTGAFCNDRPIHSNTDRDLSEALVATGFTYNRESQREVHLARLNQILQNVFDIRRNGACTLDLCWLASGRIDAYYEDVKPWDIAAAGLIVREAGGKTGLFGPPDSTLPSDLQATAYVAASAHLYNQIHSLLASTAKA